jgi:hypothetical protein
MNSDLTLLIILAVGTLLLNKDHIFAEWFSASDSKLNVKSDRSEPVQ